MEHSGFLHNNITLEKPRLLFVKIYKGKFAASPYCLQELIYGLKTFKTNHTDTQNLLKSTSPARAITANPYRHYPQIFLGNVLKVHKFWQIK